MFTMSHLSHLTNARSRSISAENTTGEKGMGGRALHGTGEGCARELGQGWKISPSVVIAPHTLYTMADIHGSGIIRHIWLTPAGIQTRYAILRIYWDDSPVPSVECPLGDFFANAYNSNSFHSLSSLAVCNNPRNGMNCYWEMPYRTGCRITIENLGDDNFTLFYQIDYTEEEVPADMGYFHAQFRRSNPLPYATDHTILTGVSGKGQYVGTYIAWSVNNNGWWGEGEIKFFLDGDKEFPTICGTGTEDYFCGAYCFDEGHRYVPFCTPYSGFLTFPPDGMFKSQQEFSMYRWHITDPIYFDEDIRVTIQALGWRTEGRYLPLQDDISSVAYWYQNKPAVSGSELIDRNHLEII